MTQLVELQEVASALRTAGYEVYAISNDPQQVLGDFSARHGIVYPLLSDPDSAVIRRYGILNTLIEPHEGRSMRWYGIPYPGTYVTDETGTITHKFFHQHHATRASGRSLLYALTGEGGADDRTPAARAEGDDLTLEVHLLDDRLRLEVLSTLRCTLQIREDLHLYAPGSPEGFVVTGLTVTGQGVRTYEATWPEPAVFRMEALGLTLPVWTGDVDVTVPLTAGSELIKLGHGLDRPTVTIDVEVRYQACNEDECFMPGTLRQSLEVPLDTLVEPEGLQIYVDRVERG
jgi:peroxiredoxin